MSDPHGTTHRVDLAGERFDPITLEVIRHRLDKIAEEMQATLLKSSCSPIVKEGLDPDDKSRPHPPYTNANVLQGRGPRGGHTFACSRRWWHLGRRSTCPFCTTPGIPVVAPADATTLVMACATGRGGPSHPGEDEVGLRGDSPRR